VYCQPAYKLQSLISYKHQQVITIVQTSNTSMKEALLEIVNNKVTIVINKIDLVLKSTKPEKVMYKLCIM
jgi:hypothetical protein